MTAFLVWLKAQGIYALILIPALFVPFIYVMALFYAWIWGIPALLAFIIVVELFKQSRWYNLPALMLAALVITMLATYGAAWQFSGGNNTWNEFMSQILYPMVGWIAALLAVFSSRNDLRKTILDVAVDQSEELAE